MRAGVLDRAGRADADRADAGRDGGAGVRVRARLPGGRGGGARRSALGAAVLAALPWLTAAAVAGSLSSSQAEGVARVRGARRARPRHAGQPGQPRRNLERRGRTSFAHNTFRGRRGRRAARRRGCRDCRRVRADPPRCRCWCLAAVAVVVPAAMATGPGLAAVEATVRALPGLGVVRDAQKWVALAVPGYALAGAAAVVTLRRPDFRPRRRRVICCAALIATLPDLAWGVGGKVSAVRYPPGWAAAAAIDQRRPAPGRGAARRQHAALRVGGRRARCSTRCRAGCAPTC